MFVFDGKKDEFLGFITIYISHEILFHKSGINYPHSVWKKLKSLFDKVNESQVMHLENELTSLNPHSFQRIEDYLTHVNKLQLKLGECGNDFSKKDG